MRLSQKQQGTAIERISSGLKINRGADDAAGLSVSSKLRQQIRGLRRAVDNAQDGISMLNSADGALKEHAAVMQRMRELAVQAGDGSYTVDERVEIQKEVDQLVDELDRIASTTEFNTRNLLDSSSGVRVSTDQGDLRASLRKAESDIPTGMFNVRLDKESNGAIQKLTSAAFHRQGARTGLGDTSTRLKDVQSFVDTGAAQRLESGLELTVKGEKGEEVIRLNSSTTMGELMESLNETSRRVSDDDSRWSYEGSQLFFDAGRSGDAGRIDLFGSEAVINALALEEVQDSSNDAYSVRMTSEDGFDETVYGDNGLASFESGLDVRFEPLSSPEIRTTRPAEDIVYLAQDVSFVIADTNNHPTPPSGGTEQTTSQPVTVSLSGGRSYTPQDLVDSINDARNSVPAADRPGYNAILTDEGQIAIRSDWGGTSAKISIVSNADAKSFLGLETGATIGSGGSESIGQFGLFFPNVLTVNASRYRVNFTLFDSDADEVGTLVQSANLAPGTTLTRQQAEDFYNQTIRDAGVDDKIRAFMHTNNRIRLASIQTGRDARYRVNVIPGSGELAASGGGHSGNVNAFGDGNSAVVEVDTPFRKGYFFNSEVEFTIGNENGQSKTVLLDAPPPLRFDGTPVSTTAFALSQTQLVSILDNANLGDINVEYEIDDDGQLAFRSQNAGKEARLYINTTTQAMAQVAKQAMGSSFNFAAQGAGRSNFRLRIEDRRLDFQIGSSQSQNIRFAIGDVRSESLGLKGISIMNEDLATEAISKLDNALSNVSSQRSQLGSLTRRLQNTVNSLGNTQLNLTDSESRIRDVDIAAESVQQAQAKFREIAGSAQFQNIKSIDRQALRLLGL